MKDILDFTNKVVLVTGSTRGMGRVTAELFAEQGASVIINGSIEGNVKNAVEELKKKGYKNINGIKADIGNSEEVDKMFRIISEKYGSIDVLINNAAIRSTTDLEAIDEKMWSNVLGVNTIGVFNASRAAAKLMKQNGSGVIINITSGAAIFPFTFYGLHYSASKGALIPLTRGLAFKFGAFGIRVNAIMAGPVAPRPSFTKEQNRLYEKALKSTALGREGLPEEISSACLFLASDMASAITGEILAVGASENGSVNY